MATKTAGKKGPKPPATKPTEPTTPTATLTREFFTAGQAVFTVELPEEFVKSRTDGRDWRTHYVFGVRAVELSDKVRLFVDSFPQHEKAVYVGVLEPGNAIGTAPDAKTRAERIVRLTKGSKFPPHSTRVEIVRRVLLAIWEGRAEDISKAGWRVMHDGRCARCRRQLTDPVSIDRGIGPDCYEMMCAETREAAEVAATPF
ncbi:MAG TPA: DUF6011 domain-containing protein [Gemmata sp.]